MRRRRGTQVPGAAEAWLVGSPEHAAALVSAHGDDPEWLNRFVRELGRRRSSSQLRRVIDVWQLSETETAGLFGVSRQTVSNWATSGVPPERAAAIVDLAAMTDLLVRYLRAGLVPETVRRPAADTAGHSLLEIAGASTRDALAHTRRMFDFAGIQA